MQHARYGTYLTRCANGDGVAMLLSGKVAVIFGGSGAIGNAVAQAMTREGAHVYLGARRQEKLDWAASIIRTAGGTVDTFITDVLDEHDASKQITQLAQQTGGIDAVNATGFSVRTGQAHRCIIPL